MAIHQKKGGTRMRWNYYQSHKAKYLGVFLYKKINWKLNIQESKKKALIPCMGNKWGLRAEIVKWIYTAVILRYRSLVWRHKTPKHQNK